jgi:hypothetical protein
MQVYQEDFFPLVQPSKLLEGYFSSVMRVTYSALHILPNLLQCQKQYHLKQIISKVLLVMAPCTFTLVLCSKVVKRLTCFHIKFKKKLQ